MSTPKSKLYVITCAIKLTSYIIDICEKSPKKFRFSFIPLVENNCFDIIRLMYEANDLDVKDDNRLSKQNECKNKLRLLEVNIEIGLGIKCFTAHQRSYMVELLGNTMIYLEKWIESDLKRKK